MKKQTFKQLATQALGGIDDQQTWTFLTYATLGTLVANCQQSTDQTMRHIRDKQHALGILELGNSELEQELYEILFKNEKAWEVLGKNLGYTGNELSDIIYHKIAMVLNWQEETSPLE